MTVLKNYHQFDGIPFATGYLRNALDYKGVKAPHTGQPYTEAMLMGINGGLCAGYFAFEYEGHLPHLHFLTRYIFDENPGAVFERLAIPMHVQQTPNPEKGVANVINGLAKGEPVIVWLDVIALDPLFDSADDEMRLVMPVLVYGYDMASKTVNIADRACVPLTASTDTFAAARARTAKTRHKMMTIGEPDKAKLPAAIEGGIRACISIFTEEPPVGPKSSFGFDAYKKWVKLLTDNKDKKGWAKMFAPGPRMYNGLKTSYQYIEAFFTGGRGARSVYADFLDEAAQVLNKPALREVASQFRDSARLWGAFTTALLPDHIAPFKETRELLMRSYTQFLTQGGAALAERRQIATRLDAIQAKVEKDFPLTETEAAQMRAELAGHVAKIHDTEVAAISALKECIE